LAAVAAAVWLEWDTGAAVCAQATLRRGVGDGPQGQLRLMRFMESDPDGHLDWSSLSADQLAFWLKRTTAGGGFGCGWVSVGVDALMMREEELRRQTCSAAAG